MIKNWFYVQNSLQVQQDIKLSLKDLTYKTLDIGGSFNYWSYPQALYLADLVPARLAPSDFNPNNIVYFNFNIQNENTWAELLKYVEQHGKFDYIICSHTLEDIMVPTKLLDLLPKLGKEGYIAIPSKYNEFKFLHGKKYRGNAHHKQIIDVKDNSIIIYPKYSFIEVYPQTDELLKTSKGEELCIFWKDEIPYKFFAEDKVFLSDDELIHNFYQEINSN